MNSYIGRDFAGKEIKNARKPIRINRSYSRSTAAALAFGAFALGVNSSKPAEHEAEWYNVTVPGAVVADCYGREDTARNWNWDRYLHEINERNPTLKKKGYEVKNLTLPDTDGDGKVCGQKVK